MKNQNKLLTGEILGFDVGLARTGVARANTMAQIPEPLQHIEMKNGRFVEQVMRLIEQWSAQALVFGLPRNLHGDDTAQTNQVRQVVEGVKELVSVPIYFIDEAGTTVRAQELKRQFDHKATSLDSLSACLILEDFFSEYRRGHI